LIIIFIVKLDFSLSNRFARLIKSNWQVVEGLQAIRRAGHLCYMLMDPKATVVGRKRHVKPGKVGNCIRRNA
jgi:hypothetical protein